MPSLMDEYRIKAAEEMGLNSFASWEEILKASSKELFKARLEVLEQAKSLDQVRHTELRDYYAFLFRQYDIFITHALDQPESREASLAVNRYFTELGKLWDHLNEHGLENQMIHYFFRLASQYTINHPGYPSNLLDI